MCSETQPFSNSQKLSEKVKETTSITATWCTFQTSATRLLGQLFLEVPQLRYKHWGALSFTMVAPKLQNKLHSNLCLAPDFGLNINTKQGNCIYIALFQHKAIRGASHDYSNVKIKHRNQLKNLATVFKLWKLKSRWMSFSRSPCIISPLIPKMFPTW